ncbi:MAG TPA: DUF3667 domain-containing protein [Sphingomicrobium sp.]|nr:DUF3667 domain-containing protein [Sphingomicrobium sp.]
MPDPEAVGDAATGGLVARAVEPGAGEGDDGHTHETRCLNCGAELAGEYCHHCGQRAHVHRSLGGFFHDLVHGVLHFEGKIWRTLPLLIGRPGSLTRRYIDGQRVRFVSPIALFLFSVFLMFAILTVAGPAIGPSTSEIRPEIKVDISAEQAKLARLEAARVNAVASGASTAAVDAQIRETRAEMEMLEAIRDGRVSDAVIRRAAPGGSDNIQWFEDAYLRARQNPQLLVYKLKTNSYKFSWALIPLSVPFLWLLFPFNRRFRLYDHTVFITYSLSFMSMLIVAAVLLAAAGLGTIAALALVVPPIHMYLQLRGAYGLTRIGAAWRTALLVSFAFVAVLAFALLLVAVGVS